MDKLPVRSVVILCLCMTLNSYTLVNLFPYVGLMVKGLLGLETINEVGEWAVSPGVYNCTEVPLQ